MYSVLIKYLSVIHLSILHPTPALQLEQRRAGLPEDNNAKIVKPTCKLLKHCVGLSIFLMWSYGIFAQGLSSISIEQCYQWAQENYPLVDQLDLIERSKEYNLSNASKGLLPQININGQATYQSDVTALPINLPNVDVPTISKDQYKLYAEIHQPLTNRSAIKSKQQQISIDTEIEKQEVTVELYKLKERVNHLYFGILLIDGQITQLDLLQDDLEWIVYFNRCHACMGTGNRKMQSGYLFY